MSLVSLAEAQANKREEHFFLSDRPEGRTSMEKTERT